MRKHSVFIYESGKEEREGLVKYLTTHDYETAQTGDADNVLAMLAQREFDVMLVDLDPDHIQASDRFGCLLRVGDIVEDPQEIGAQGGADTEARLDNE